MNDQTVTLNHNAAECIKATTAWGETIYHNICSGAAATVPWGSIDYVLGSLLIALTVGILGAIGMAGYAIVDEFWY